MTQTMRCPFCGGLNPAAAEWCGQCMRRFADAGRDEATRRPEDASASSRTQTAASPLQVPPPLAATSTAGDGSPFKVTDTGVIWTCTRCGTDNELDQEMCRVCGMTFAEMVRPAAPDRPPRDPNMAALLSLFMPGLGHGYLGMWGHGLARALVSTWVVMVVIIAALQEGVAGSRLIAAAFAVAAFGLWGAAAHDAYREARGEGPLVLLKGRSFMYVVLGLLALLVLLIVPAVLQVRA